AYSPVITLTPGMEPDAAGENNPYETVGAAQDDADELNGDMTVDFGFIPMMSLGSTVFYDVDNDGVQDENNPLESGIAGVTVYLYDATGTNILDSTITDADGNYFFDSLSPGTYVVGVVAPADAQTASTPVGGDDDVDGDNNGNPVVMGISQSTPIVLTAGGETADEDA
ncbi:MAG: carboxypeptidase regulatory-like domain-containing protein, partial [Saprospiraceae bacterium]|nr:carboxypeptidase regulatory-like domain-containing protein [Saprospiraceae bacterium]